MYVGDHNQRQGPDQAELGLVGREGEGRGGGNQVWRPRVQKGRVTKWLDYIERTAHSPWVGEFRVGSYTEGAWNSRG